MTDRLPGFAWGLTSDTMTTWATLSGHGTYRYDLGRQWDPDRPLALFVMLNPSTADADRDDLTIRRCCGFARREGMGGIVVGNLFAFRATKPADLLAAADPIGPDNAAHLERLCHRDDVALKVAAWGAWWTGLHVKHRPARLALGYGNSRRWPGPWSCLGTTADGSPRHPSRLPVGQPLEPWTP